jgi:hypothetical protein
LVAKLEGASGENAKNAGLLFRRINCSALIARFKRGKILSV